MFPIVGIRLRQRKEEYGRKRRHKFYIQLNTTVMSDQEF